ncbi:hypothetical protein SARC_08109 [Sphaeroforma arctica JP610]|uniref:Uncharacterized protein n=1 Tax=Sphaeroforma arctica JP610 TaxID=667725 RepID=A0A0L0FU99_9EUKA|nr:hypothetical protein SARC_08109 [Sphaeroforma arctica JP610]KNC79503.1 hypothetical protein SARC_08109 [Sphaeroforma arctica JP610]|eukprot:XP_014153405.1 hypothetical protein SARC_08109 [Sphaeroforma arctica JP610]
MYGVLSHEKPTNMSDEHLHSTPVLPRSMEGIVSTLQMEQCAATSPLISEPRYGSKEQSYPYRDLNDDGIQSVSEKLEREILQKQTIQLLKKLHRHYHPQNTPKHTNLYDSHRHSVRVPNRHPRTSKKIEKMSRTSKKVLNDGSCRYIHLRRLQELSHLGPMTVQEKVTEYLQRQSLHLEAARTDVESPQYRGSDADID